MAVYLEIGRPAPGPVSGRLDRHDAEARQDRWMLELERAAFASLAKPERVRGSVHPDAAPARTPDDGVDAGAAGPHQPGPPAVRLAAAHDPRHAADGRAPAKERLRHPAPAAAHGWALAGVAPQAQDTPVAQQAQDMPLADSGRPAGPHDPTAQGAVRAPIDRPRIAPPYAGAADTATPPAPGIGIAPGESPAFIAPGGAGFAPVRPGASSPGASLTATAPPVAEMVLGLAPFAGAAPADRPRPDTTDQPAPADGAPDPHAADQAEHYARSLLHVYRNNQGVHAWVRDAALSEGQLRAVAQALAGEFARAGTPLAALMVNGKKIVSASAGNAIGREQEEAATAAGAAQDDFTPARHPGAPAVQGVA